MRVAEHSYVESDGIGFDLEINHKKPRAGETVPSKVPAM